MTSLFSQGGAELCSSRAQTHSTLRSVCYSTPDQSSDESGYESSAKREQHQSSLDSECSEEPRRSHKDVHQTLHLRQIDLLAKDVEQFDLENKRTNVNDYLREIKQKWSEAPREYYRRLRTAYFQGSSALGLEEDRGFKSLFLHNLHPSVRTQVALTCRQGFHSMREIRRLAQMTWETIVKTANGNDDEPRVLRLQDADEPPLALEGGEAPKGGPPWRNPGPNRPLPSHHQRERRNRQGKARRDRRQVHSDYGNRPSHEKGRREQGGWQQDRHPRSGQRRQERSDRNSKHKGRDDRHSDSDQPGEFHSELESLKAQLAEIKELLQKRSDPSTK
ncbi:uncharacterized protein LOC132898048 [Neoarius graeffei]|uniref:uncharacterized protein LOC132898048 n=1 Tax=Neoarius graeffei TaxID=443677 RepID=UPI00298D2509|nr:uncharacterized protein LOC132898048 [Neoarius graeffei]